MGALLGTQARQQHGAGDSSSEQMVDLAIVAVAGMEVNVEHRRWPLGILPCKT